MCPPRKWQAIMDISVTAELPADSSHASNSSQYNNVKRSTSWVSSARTPDPENCGGWLLFEATAFQCDFLYNNRSMCRVANIYKKEELRNTCSKSACFLWNIILVLRGLDCLVMVSLQAQCGLHKQPKNTWPSNHQFAARALNSKAT